MAFTLLTGGAGFIGSHTAAALAARGDRVRILDILDPQIHGEEAEFPDDLDPAVETVRGDVRDPRAVHDALDDVDAVIHLAARTGVGQSMYDSGSYVDTNVGGTAVLLDQIAARGRPLERFVLASSRAVYGEGAALCPAHGVVHPGTRRRSDLERGRFASTCPQCAQPVTPVPTSEDSPRDPGSVYALTKQMQEDLCGQAASTFGLPVVVLRYFNVYGSRQSLHNPYTGVVTVFFSRLRDGRPIALYEHGLPTRDFVHVSDVVRANLAAIDRPVPRGSCINIGGGGCVTVRGLAEAMAKALGREPEFDDRGQFRVGDIFACTADLARAGRLLAYRPRCGLDEGLGEFLDWARDRDASGAIPFERTVEELEERGLLGTAE